MEEPQDEDGVEEEKSPKLCRAGGGGGGGGGGWDGGRLLKGSSIAERERAQDRTHSLRLMLNPRGGGLLCCQVQSRYGGGEGNREWRGRRHEGDVGEAEVEQKVETETEQQSDADLQSLD